MKLATGFFWLLVLGPPMVWPSLASAQAPPAGAQAQVVLVFDNSTSMKEPGMDPNRTSLLVAKLFADVVPGDLAIVRMLDLYEDRAFLPREETPVVEACDEDPTQQCTGIKIKKDEVLQLIQDQRVGALRRPKRGDAPFKQALDEHLAPKANNTYASLGFAAARSVFESSGPRKALIPRFVLWLTDGRPQAAWQGDIREELGKLAKARAEVSTFLFNRGPDQIALENGLPVMRVSDSLSMVQAFADALYGILETRHRISKRVSEDSSFQIEPRVYEAWVIVWGDDTLRSVELVRPDGWVVAASHGADQFSGAGGYRVAYLVEPPEGRWAVRTTGGGPTTAYAVIQRDGTRPELRLPPSIMAGASPEFAISVSDANGNPITDKAILGELKGSVTNQTGSHPLIPHETEPVLSGPVPFPAAGQQDAVVGIQRVHDDKVLLDKKIPISVEVEETFRYEGPPTNVELGRLSTGQEGCQLVEPKLTQSYPAKLAFRVNAPSWFPSGYELEVRGGGRTMSLGTGLLMLKPGESFSICLLSKPWSQRSTIKNQELVLAVDGTEGLPYGIPLSVSWDVRPPSFLDLYGKALAAIAGVLLVIFVAVGFIVPVRFPPRLAIALTESRQDLDDCTPEPLRSFAGIGSGFFRNARAYLRPNFQWSGRAEGAVACIRAEKGGPRVLPTAAAALYFENADGAWQALPTDGRRVQAGDNYRVGDRGPYFRTSSRI